MNKTEGRWKIFITIEQIGKFDWAAAAHLLSPFSSPFFGLKCLYDYGFCVVIEGYENFICDNTVYVDYQKNFVPHPEKTSGSFSFLIKKIFQISYWLLWNFGRFFVHLCVVINHKVRKKFAKFLFLFTSYFREIEKKLLSRTNKSFST